MITTGLIEHLDAFHPYLLIDHETGEKLKRKQTFIGNNPFSQGVLHIFLHSDESKWILVQNTS